MGRKRSAVGHPDAESTVYQSAGDPLLTALFEGDVEGARQLLEAGGCDVEAADQLGWRPLHRAAFGGFDGITAALLERRADPLSTDTDGLQPLHIAAAGGHADCCQLLLNARADPTAPEQYSGMSAQMYTLVQEGEQGKRMQEVLGVPDLAGWAAWGDPLAMARHVASLEDAEEREALEARWATQLGTTVCLPCQEEGGSTEEALAATADAAAAACPAASEDGGCGLGGGGMAAAKTCATACVEAEVAVSAAAAAAGE